MAINPMQRKARNAFLLGMLVMLVIAAIVVGLLFMQIMQMKKKEQQVQTASKYVYMLTRDVKSGEMVTTDDVKRTNIVTNINSDEIVTDSELTQLIEQTNSLGETELVADETNMKVATIDLPAGAFLTRDMITLDEEQITDDLRVQEYNMIVLPSDLSKEDYIDVRLSLPNGQDYIVISKKRVLKSTQNTVFLKMTEAEMVTMSNAIVESYKINGSMLYATKYKNAGLQNASTPNYIVSDEVVNLISKNPNIVMTARNEIVTRYNNNGDLRGNIRNSLPEDTDEGNEAVNTGVQEQVQKQKSERTKYIETLGEE